MALLRGRARRAHGILGFCDPGKPAWIFPTQISRHGFSRGRQTDGNQVASRCDYLSRRPAASSASMPGTSSQVGTTWKAQDQGISRAGTPASIHNRKPLSREDA